ncbi:MAG: hypothetical protein U0L92_03000 [Clostridia bacterium]|nr:hypothetical protein [Clostridia bacterium]
MERNAEPNYEKMEQDIAAIERQLEEELETELKQRLNKDGLEWFESHKAKRRLLENAKEMLFFMKGWKSREKFEH